MTREEAILWMRVLKHSKINWVGEKAEEKDTIKRCEEAEQEAFDMAIDALQTNADCSTCKHKDKDWDSEECDSCCGNNNHYEAEYIIPSGDVMFTSDVVRCKDCIQKHIGGSVTHYYWCDRWDREVDETDYCAWAERREPNE